MKKFGFTLAEVLITLGIIGVVAALTTPALVKNSAKAKIGPSLSKFVNSFETATEQMFEKEVMEGYENVSADMALLSKYLIMTPIREGIYKFKTYDGKNSQTIYTTSEVDKMLEGCAGNGNNGYGEENSECKQLETLKTKTASESIWQLKDGSIMAVIPATNNSKISKGAYKGIIAEIIYDIDGNKDENRAGKDVYAFLLDRTGVLIPVGSNAHKNIEQSGEKYATSYTNCAYGSNLASNLACTGKIADNYWKLD